jgi:hypothetical protein
MACRVNADPFGDPLTDTAVETEQTSVTRR